MTRAFVLICLVAVAAPVCADPRPDRSKVTTTLPLPVALADMPAATREALTKVMKDPTLTTVSPPEEFVAHPDMYQWLLDHPDRAAAAWRKLGVAAVEIKPLKDGRFCWKDENGSELVWQNVAQGPTGRVWYAEGRVKPGAVLPTVPVTAVAILSHSDKQRPTGDATIKQQLEVFLHTDSKTAALVTKAFGESAPKMAQQGTEQLLMFFSGIAKYAHDRPEKARGLLTSDSGR
jgi:hypothetical protein